MLHGLEFGGLKWLNGSTRALAFFFGQSVNRPRSEPLTVVRSGVLGVLGVIM